MAMRHTRGRIAHGIPIAVADRKKYAGTMSANWRGGHAQGACQEKNDELAFHI